MKTNLARQFSGIEPLEPRIAPALVVAADGRSGTYDDSDGDHVTLTVTKGDLHNAPTLFAADQLRSLDLKDAGFDGANLTVSVVKVRGGDGLANIGGIDATGRDL